MKSVKDEETGESVLPPVASPYKTTLWQSGAGNMYTQFTADGDEDAEDNGVRFGFSASVTLARKCVKRSERTQVDNCRSTPTTSPTDTRTS